MDCARILVLTPTLDGRDGLSCLARQVVIALGERFADAAIDVWVLGDAGDLDTGSLRVRSAHGQRIRLGRWALTQAVARPHPDLVVVLHLHLLPLALPFAWRGVPVVPFLVGIEAWRPLRGVRALAMRAARRAVAISAHTAREFGRANPDFGALPIEICRPAAPTLDADVAPTTLTKPFALIVARLASDERYKGHDLLIELWPEVIRARPDARLVIAGGGDDEARLRERVRAARLNGAITFTGVVDGSMLASLYRECAMFVLPSRYEGFGLVLLEAMSQGRACVAAAGAPEEIVEHGVTGLIVDAANAAAVRDAIVQLFSDPGLCARFGAAGAARARDAFAPARFADDLGAILGPLLPARASASLC